MSDETVITVHDQATEVLGKMLDRVTEVGRYWGEDSPEHVKMAASYARGLYRLLIPGFSKAPRIFRDGELSLYIVDGTFHWGLIFHTKHRMCTVCSAMLEASGSVRYQSQDKPRCADGEHVPDYPFDAPTLGEWSSHS